MRAERLPDLVNQNQAKRRSTVETIVTATFDISDVADRLIREDEEEDALASDAEDFLDTSDKTQVADAASAVVEAEIVESDTLPDSESLDLDDIEAQVLAARMGSASEQANAQAQNGKSVDSPNGNGPNGNGSSGNGAGGNGANGNGSNGNGASPQEWKVTRRLRVTSQGTYTSNYYINGEACTLNQLHEQLQRFRIYPEGYNVVLQGDVTSIISMNARERREIIDELAGVASFDRKINQAKGKLDVVKDREERFRIVETELMDQLERLDQDRKKAEKYKRLKAELSEKQKWEGVMQWQQQRKEAEKLSGQIAKGHEEGEAIAQKITALTTQMEKTAEELAVLNAQVKALGEEEYLALQAKLATQEAELRQLVRQEESLAESTRGITAQLARIQEGIQTQEGELGALAQQIRVLTEEELGKIASERDAAVAELEAKREETNAIADQSQAWIKQQTDLRKQIEALLSLKESGRRQMRSQANLRHGYSSRLNCARK